MSTELLKKLILMVQLKVNERPKYARYRQNIQRVSKLICSQDDNPHSDKSTREIEKETSSKVRHIVKQDL